MNQKIESQNGVLEDITACTTGQFCLSNDPKMMELKSHTPARIGIGRTGSRYLTKAYLRFRADHAAANDAVMTEVSQETLERLRLPQVQTRCKDKYEMLTRPDLGRLFDDENKAKIKAVCTPNPDVQIYCGDGLSAPCIGANVPDLLPMLTLALKQAGITVGIPFFVRYCRVNTARTIGPLVGAKVTWTADGREYVRLHCLQRPTGYERERLHRGVQHQPLRYGTGRSRSLYCRRDPRPAAKGWKVKTNKKRPVVCCGQQVFYLISVSGGCGAL